MYWLPLFLCCLHLEAGLSYQLWSRVDQFNERRKKEFGRLHDSTPNRKLLWADLENFGSEA